MTQPLAKLATMRGMFQEALLAAHVRALLAQEEALPLAQEENRPLAQEAANDIHDGTTPYVSQDTEVLKVLGLGLGLGLGVKSQIPD